MRFTSVAGHLMGIEFPPEFKLWHSCDPAVLFTAPIIKSVPPDKLNLKRTLEAEARNADVLALWLDCDREGENIAYEARSVVRISVLPRPVRISCPPFKKIIIYIFYISPSPPHILPSCLGFLASFLPPYLVFPFAQVIAVCQAVNPRLTLLRAKFSALVPRDIRRAADTLVAPDEPVSQAVDARQELDLRLGAALTRFQTGLLQSAFDFGDGAVGGKGPTLSYGPCQFPTLGFVVLRGWEAEAHVPESYWALAMTHAQPQGQGQPPKPPVRFTWGRGRLFDRAVVAMLHGACRELNQATVMEVSGNPILKYPPHPLSTLELQKRLARVERLSPEVSLKLAEELYQV